MENRSHSPSRIEAVSSSVHQRGVEPFANLNNTFKRSFISTSRGKNSIRSGSNEKAKIKALPNYQKYSMGNNLPFITVFQTIEIERLSEEVETQRIQLKEYERQIFNAQNFEIQIKQLSEKCAAYEDQIGQYRDELDKMNKICQALYHENETLKIKLKDTDSTFKSKLDEEVKKNLDLEGDVERWRKKFHNSEKEKHREIEQIKQMMQKQRKSMLDREMKDIQIRHQNQVSNLSIEIRRLSELVGIKEKENEELKKESEKNRDYLRDIRDYSHKIAEYEEKIALLSQEHLRLSEIIDVNSNELDKARKKEIKLAQKLQTDKEMLADNKHLKQLIQAREEELEEYKVKAQGLQEDLNQYRDLAFLNHELQTKLDNAVSDNEKLSKLLKQRSSQIEKWKKISRDLEGSSQKHHKMQDNFMKLQSRYSHLKAENESLKSLNKSKLQEIQELNQKYSAIRGSSELLAKHEKERRNIEEKYRAQVQRNQELNLMLEELQKEASGSKNLTHKVIENEKLKEYYARENEKLKVKIQEYAAEIQGMKNCEQEFMSQTTRMRENDRSIAQYEKKLALLSEEVTRLNKVLKTKNQEIVRLEDQKINTFGTISQYKNLSAEIEEKDLAIQKMKAELDKCYGKIYSGQNRIEELENSKQQLLENLRGKDGAYRDLKVKTRQCDQYKQKCLKLQQELSEVQKLCQKQQNRITVYMRDIEDLKSYSKHCEDQLQALQTKQKELLGQISRTKGPDLKRRDTNRSIVTDRIMESRQSMQDVNININPEKLVTKINNLQITVRELKDKYNNLLQAVSQENCPNQMSQLSKMSSASSTSSITE